MSGETSWDRQRGELEAYNTFYSAFTGRASDESFSDYGYFIRGLFATIQRSGGPDADPDFILYNDETFLLVEVKQGDNIEPRHADQLRACADVTITEAEDYLRANQAAEETPYDGSVDSVEACIVYSELDEGYIEEWRGESDAFTERLEELESVGAVLGQQPGSQLRVLAGSFDSTSLQTWLSEGIELPRNPKKQFFLTDGLEMESLAVAICQLWGERAVKGSNGVVVGVSEVRERFDYRPPSIPDVADVFQMLEYIGACDQADADREYVFEPSHMSEILDIEHTVDEKSVNEYLQEAGVGSSNEDQSGLTDFGTE
jgi:hypothetical protein